jgi:hypothetical protein
LDGLVQNIEVFVGNSLADCKVWDDWIEDTHRLALRICSLGTCMDLGSTCLGPYFKDLLRMALVLTSSYFIVHFLFAFSQESQPFLRAMVLIFSCPSNIRVFQLILASSNLFTPKIPTLWFPWWVRHLPTLPLPHIFNCALELCLAFCKLHLSFSIYHFTIRR